MNVLVIGRGGREHALAWKLRQSNQCKELYITPGNAGTAEVGTNIDIDEGDQDGIVRLIHEKNINLVVIGPEAPLVSGLADYLRNYPGLEEISVVGPGKLGAQLEGSKDFSKQFMVRHHIPTAGSKTITKNNIDEGLDFLNTLRPPYVLKADGLAAGKGVIITESLAEASDQLKAMVTGEKFGTAGSKVLIEEFLDGIELSVFVITDGKSYKVLPQAKDYKRIGDGDTGPNTGGMGAVSPVPFADEVFMKKVEDRIIKPTLEGLQKDLIPFKGFLFIGLMNVAGDPYVIEYNVRMGDPETQAVLPRISSDFLDLLYACGNGSLSQASLAINDSYTTTVVMAADGYPEKYEKGETISFDSLSSDDAIIFHAGTTEKNGVIKTNGGRVLAVTGSGRSLKNALDAAYSGVNTINWKGRYFRKDIGRDIINQVWLDKASEK